MNKFGVTVVVLFLLPLTLSIFSGFLGVEILSRDDLNYLGELADISKFELRFDFLSWFILSLGTDIFGLNSTSLRLVGFLIAVSTIATLILKTSGYRTLLFIVSVLPLYINIYFSQLRLAIAIFIFVWLVSVWNFKKLAIALGALAHISFLIILFPLVTLLALFPLEAILQLDFFNPLSVKFNFYLNNNFSEVPSYFGWELLLVALAFGWQKKWPRFLEILLVLMTVRLIGAELSLDIGRRILELGILAYSPFFLQVLRNESMPKHLIPCYLILAIIQVPISIYSGVINF